MTDPAPIHPKNATGPFYVVNGCCTACGVPTAIAPELFDFDATDHCYVKRQPNSDAEMEKALQDSGLRSSTAFDIAAMTKQSFGG